MKKAILVLGIILTSGIAAWSLNKKVEPANQTAQVKIERSAIQTSNFGNNKSDIATAD